MPKMKILVGNTDFNKIAPQKQMSIKNVNSVLIQENLCTAILSRKACKN